MYQQTRLSDTSAIGAPGPLPDVIATWGSALDILADLTGQAPKELGFDGTGFWPVDVAVPAFDPSSKILVEPIACDSVDATARRWKAIATVRAMSDAEFLAANPVPPQVTNYQARRALRAAGLFDKVDAAIRAAGDPTFIDAWDYANVFLRGDPVIQALPVALNPPLTSRQVDDLFRAAARFG